MLSKITEMETIAKLEEKLAFAKKAQALTKEYMPRVYTDIVIDLRGPQGNIHCIIGLCKRLAREYLEKWEEDIFTQETRLDNGKSYQQLLDTCQRWFGLIYIR
jgi:hypothetical protein